jgi:hypothetical protein
MKEQDPDNIYKFSFDNSIELLCVATTEGNFVKLNAKWESTPGLVYRYNENNLLELWNKRFETETGKIT